MGAITHIVLFDILPHIPPTETSALCQRMLALQTQCVRKDTDGKDKPYILSVRGGANCSVEEDVKAKFSHGFVVEFASEEDRRFYLEEDAAHRAFVEGLEGLVGGVGVVDFEGGVW